MSQLYYFLIIEDCFVLGRYEVSTTVTLSVP